MKEVLIALAKLSKIDDDARTYDEELRELPLTIAEMSANVATLEGVLEAERLQHQEAQEVRQAHREDMTARQDSLARARTKANQASNVREMTAAEREVDTNRRLIREREEDAAKLDAALATAVASLNDHEEKLSAFRTMYEEAKKQAEERIAALEAKRAEVIKGREELATLVTPQVVRRYERIRARRGSGVAIVDGPTCVCRISIGAQVFNEMQRGSDLHECRSCNRYLIWSGILDIESSVDVAEASEGSPAAEALS